MSPLCPVRTTLDSLLDLVNWTPKHRTPGGRASPTAHHELGAT